jgi:hypothetical protein
MSYSITRPLRSSARLSAVVLVASSFGLAACSAEVSEEEAAAPDAAPVASAAQPIFEDGCSAPWLASVALSTITFNSPNSFFGPECRRHDYCYHSGRAAYEYSRATCDQQFLDGMLSHCYRSYGEYNPLRQSCKLAAEAYYAGVRAGGDPHYLGTRCALGETNSSSCSTYEPYEAASITPAFKSRIGIQGSNRSLYAKEGGLSASWNTLATSGVTKFQQEGFRVGVLLGGTLYVKEGSLGGPVSGDTRETYVDQTCLQNVRDSAKCTFSRVIPSPWRAVAGDVVDFQLSGNRVGVIQSNGNAWVKEGALGAQWVIMRGDARRIQLEQTRVAVLDKSNVLYAKEGSLYANWVTLQSNVSDFQLEDDRVMTLVGSTLHGKVGALGAPFYAQTEAGAVKRFQLDGGRIGALRTDGTLIVREGPPNAGAAEIREPYVDQTCMQYVRDSAKCTFSRVVTPAVPASPYVTVATGVSSFQLRGARIGVLQNGTLSVKDGALGATWYGQMSGVKAFSLAGTRIAALTTEDKLFVKEGSVNAPAADILGPVYDATCMKYVNDRNKCPIVGQEVIIAGAPFVLEADGVTSFQLWTPAEWERSDYLL